MNHQHTVAAIYEAFGLGDIPAILDRLSPDVAWDEPGQSADAPWIAPRHGRQGAAEFFQALGEVDIHRFDVKTILESGDLVVALFDFECTVKATGVGVKEVDGIHLWRFGADGLAHQFRHRVDSHQYWLANRG